MQLAKREKYLVVFAAIFIAAALVFTLLIMPFWEERTRLRNNVAVQQNSLEQMAGLRREYLLLQQDSGTVARRLAARAKNFTLFSFLEKAAGDAGVKENIKSMKPSASTGTVPQSRFAAKWPRFEITGYWMAKPGQLAETGLGISSITRRYFTSPRSMPSSPW